ncbi:MAG: hypothetical protein [Olavius algarvensis Gamma 1 endosymbiont]|nr:MAG: hypothetical protein [Olavius algarvensis Gamma 1 endosymbiont]
MREHRNSESSFKLAQQRRWLLLASPEGSPPNAPERYSAWQEGELFPARCALPWRVWGTLRS